MKQEIIIATISIVIATLIASPLLSSNVLAHGVAGKTAILYDSPSGNLRGWNPDGHSWRFSIFDLDFSPFTSTVLVNLRSSTGLHSCNVDNWIYNFTAGVFYLVCTVVPEGAELHYTIFNPICLSLVGCLGSEVDPSLIGNVLKSSKNMNKGIEDAPSREQQRQLANVTGDDGR